ncbi:MAG: VOC family protein, partial [Acidimicrobiales bacterium]
MDDRPFRILGIQQVAVGAPAKDRLRHLWVDLFGLTATGTFVNTSENKDEESLGLGNGPTAVEFDIME